MDTSCDQRTQAAPDSKQELGSRRWLVTAFTRSCSRSVGSTEKAVRTSGPYPSLNQQTSSVRTWRRSSETCTACICKHTMRHQNGPLAGCTSHVPTLSTSSARMQPVYLRGAHGTTSTFRALSLESHPSADAE